MSNSALSLQGQLHRSSRLQWFTSQQLLFLQPGLADYRNCEALSGIKLLLERFHHVGGFFFSMFAEAVVFAEVDLRPD